MGLQSTANVVWEGDLMSGKGVVSTGTSPAFKDLPVSWASRTEAHAGKTSPEELLASAHASCFAMALSAGLGRGGTPPQKLEVGCTVTFEKVEAGWRVVNSALTVKGTVPNLDAAGFTAAAEAAKEGCPISNALKNNVPMSVEATLA